MMPYCILRHQNTILYTHINHSCIPFYTQIQSGLPNKKGMASKSLRDTSVSVSVFTGVGQNGRYVQNEDLKSQDPPKM